MNAQRKKYVACVATLLVLAVIGWTVLKPNPLTHVIPTDIKADKGFPDKVAELGESDRLSLVQIITRNELSKAFGGEGVFPEGTTIGQAIAMQKSFVEDNISQEKKEAELKQEVEQKNAAFQSQLKEDVTVSFINKKVHRGDYQEFIELQVAYKNNSQKDIDGIKGVMVFKDIFGDKIYSLRDSMDKGIKAGETYTSRNQGIDYSRFDSEETKLKNTPMEKIKFEYQVQKIVFSDGTVLEAPSVN